VYSGEPVQLGQRSFTLKEINEVQGPNYRATQATVEVTNGDGLITLRPEKRFYQSGGNPMTEADVHITPLRDVFVSIGDNVGGDDSWSYRVQTKALIRWIWLGALMMALGAGIAAADPRYRRARVRKTSPASSASAAGAA